MRSLAALLLLLCAGHVHALPADTWVVAIANNTGDPDELVLRYADRDARAFVDVLRELGGVASSRIRTLVDEPAAAVEATLSAVEAQVAAAKRAGRSAGLVVFYSGHADAESLHLGGTRLGFGALRARVKESSAGFRLLVVDACGSGGVSRVKGVGRAPSFALRVQGEADATGLAVITSSAAGEDSQESDRLRASFFSHHLVSGLRGAADRDRDGVVSLDEAYAYSYRETLRSSGRTMTLQHPTYNVDLKGKGEVVLTRTGRAAQRGGRLVLGEAVVHLIMDARDGELIAEMRPDRPGAQVVLPPRRYRVQERMPRVYREYAVELRAGQTVALGQQPARSVRYDRLVRKGGGEQRVVHGVTALGGVRGEIVPGERSTAQFLLGYGVDARALSAGLRLRGTTTDSRALTSGADRQHQELGLGVTLERFVDLPWFSVSVGLLLEGAVHVQTFAQDTPERRSGAFSLGALFAAERILWDGLSFRVEGGPLSTVLPRAQTARGAVVSSDTEAVFTGWLAGGLKWRL